MKMCVCVCVLFCVCKISLVLLVLHTASLDMPCIGETGWGEALS